VSTGSQQGVRREWEGMEGTGDGALRAVDILTVERDWSSRIVIDTAIANTTLKGEEKMKMKRKR